MSEPRTDKHMYDVGGGGFVTDASFARELERERNALLAAQSKVLSMMHEAASMYPGCRVPIDAMIKRATYLFESANQGATVMELPNDYLKRLERDKRVLLEAAAAVCWFDWSGNDDDACAAIDKLRAVVELVKGD